MSLSLETEAETTSCVPREHEKEATFNSPSSAVEDQQSSISSSKTTQDPGSDLVPEKEESFILVRGLSKGTTAVQLKELFKQYDRIGRVTIMNSAANADHGQRFAHIVVPGDKARVKKVVEAVNGKTLNDCALIVTEVPEKGQFSRKFVLANLTAKTTSLGIQYQKMPTEMRYFSASSSDTLVLTEELDELIMDIEKEHVDKSVTPDSTLCGEITMVSEEGKLQEEEPGKGSEKTSDLLDNSEAKMQEEASGPDKIVTSKSPAPSRDKKSEDKKEDKSKSGGSSRIKPRRSRERSRERKRSEPTKKRAKEDYRGNDRHQDRRSERKRERSRSRSVVRRDVRKPIDRIPRSPWSKHRTTEKVDQSRRSNSKTPRDSRRSTTYNNGSREKEPMGHWRIQESHCDGKKRHLAASYEEPSRRSKHESRTDIELEMLARDKEKLRREREELEREKEILLELERKKHQRERDELNREKEQLRRAKCQLLTEERRLEKRKRKSSVSPPSSFSNHLDSPKFHRSFPGKTMAERILERERQHRKLRSLDTEKRPPSAGHSFKRRDGSSSDLRYSTSDEKIQLKSDHGVSRSDHQLDRDEASSSSSAKIFESRRHNIRVHIHSDSAPTRPDELQRQTADLWKKLKSPQHSTGRSVGSGIEAGATPLVPLPPQVQLDMQYPCWPLSLNQAGESRTNAARPEVNRDIGFRIFNPYFHSQYRQQ